MGTLPTGHIESFLNDDIEITEGQEPLK